MRLYLAQFISMLVMIALGVGMFVGFNVEWKSVEGNVFSFLDRTNFADYRLVSESGFSQDDADKIAQIDGIDAVSRYLSVNVSVDGTNGDSLAMNVTENKDVSSILVEEGSEYDDSDTDGIWLSLRYAEANQVKVGDSLSLSYSGMKITGTVRGLIRAGEYLVCVRDETQLMPDYTTHGFAYISPAKYASLMGGHAYYPQIHVLSNLEKSDFIEACDEALGKTYMVLTKEESSSYSTAESEADEGRIMGSILPVLFLLIAVLTMVTTMHRLTVKEKTQIGILKALGFKNRRILLHYSSYAFGVGTVGTALGIGIGYLVAWGIMNPNGSMGTYFDMPEWKLYMPSFCVAVLVGIVVVLTLVGMLSVWGILRGTAVDSLRPYTPKKMKPLLIEKTKFFHKLSFGTRWNLRDTMRHKARTAMSLLGIAGCMLLLIGSFGMQDMMDYFLDTFYEKTTNYATRIYFSESATAEEREALKEKYNADASMTLSVQVNDKTVSLDVYDITHDYVKFTSEKKGFVTLPDDSAVVCERIAESCDLSVGDTLTVTLFGTDTHYTVTVGGVVQSISESVILSSTYAKELGLTVQPDSLYTAVSTADVESCSAVKNTQSKQAILDSFSTFTEIMNSMIVLLAAASLVLAGVVLYNLGVMSYTERYRELATLKVLGFKDKKIRNLLLGQTFRTSIVGIALGIPFGIVTLNYLCKALMSEYEMRVVLYPRTFIISIVLTLGTSLAVSLFVSRKNKKINMVEALKAGE